MVYLNFSYHHGQEEKMPPRQQGKEDGKITLKEAGEKCGAL
jgi:hypothetical protein